MTLMGRYIILFMLMLTSCAEMLAGMESLRIMTYNVPRKNEYILPEGVNTLEMRYAALADMVNNVRTDVLGMQEPTNSDLWMFLKNLKGYTMIGIARDLQPADILKKLPKGLYIVGNKKVIIP